MNQKKGIFVFGPVEHPFLHPLWRRVVLIAFCALWTLIEYQLGNTTWMYIIGAITLYGAWAYLIAYKVPGAADQLPGETQE